MQIASSRLKFANDCLDERNYSVQLQLKKQKRKKKEKEKRIVVYEKA